ncbi:M48 family metallopeptidase, partial [bacterium AH-315-J21]|nr:M48 family metallopeptidase [bacterium AH-315-J21]
GGYIYFYTGLLRIMDDEAQLAAVMSHEISHVVARHGMKRVQKGLVAQLGYAIVFGDSESSQVRDAAVGVGLSLVFAGYSRSAEAEADRYGIEYMSLAGYNPQGAVGMFEHLAEAGGRNANAFEKLVAGHPETQARIDNAESQIAAMGELSSGLRFNRSEYQRMKARLPEVIEKPAK